MSTILMTIYGLQKMPPPVWQDDGAQTFFFVTPTRLMKRTIFIMDTYYNAMRPFGSMI